MASYEQSAASKLWSVRFRENSGGAEKNKRLSGYRTKREAREAYEEYIRNIKETVPEESDADKMTFGDLTKLYLAYLKPRVKDSTYYDTKQKIISRILPYFENRKLKDIAPANIIEWHSTIGEYSYVYKKGLHNQVSSIYRFGNKYYDIKNIMLKVDNFRNVEPKKEMLFWTRQEFERFISVIDDLTYNTLFRFLYLSGCRKGEMSALAWEDVDFKKRTVSISKSITRKNTNGAAYSVTTPKNKSSYRTIEMPEKFMEQLKRYKQWQEADYGAKCAFVFCGERPLPDQTVLRTFDNYCKQAGVKKIRIHDLRHSCASLLISEGISIVAVSKRLGHKDVEQTLNTYSHMMPDDESRIISALNNI